MDEETPSPALDRIGQTVAGRYELKRLLGEGGMGAVYDAEHAVTRRHVAVKLLHDGSRWDRGSVERFLREAQIAAAIRHPGIIDVLDAGTDASGAPFLVFEMLEGYSVADLLDTQPRPPVALTLGIAREMLDALAAAHAQRIYHRDIKPENVFLATDGRGQTVVKLLDFGISKAAENVGLGRHTQTRTGVLMGTPAYMSPEQVRGQSDVDARSDVWSVGVMLYEMLAGELPFRAENINALMFAIDRDPIAPLDVVAPGTPPAVAAVVACALSRDRLSRYPDAAAMRDAVDALLASTPASLAPAVAPGPAGRTSGGLEFPTLIDGAVSSSAPSLTLDPQEADTFRVPRGASRARKVGLALVAAGALLGVAAVAALRRRDATPPAAVAPSPRRPIALPATAPPVAPLPSTVAAPVLPSAGAPTVAPDLPVAVVAPVVTAPPRRPRRAPLQRAHAGVRPVSTLDGL